jgi:hypothetical protein
VRKVLLLLASCLTLAMLPIDAGAAPTWAPEATATITPGVQMYTQGAQCTANFVFTDKKGRVYVGYAAHCAGLGESTDTNGCTTRSLPLGTPVSFVTGGSLLADGKTVGRGRLVYSSWLTMQHLHTTSANRCAYNDFALVRVLKGDRSKVNPTVPEFGGPMGLRSTPLSVGSTIYSYGNSSLRGGLGLFNAKTGSVDARVGGGLAYDVNTATSPGVPGDSGSGYLDAQGRAVGVLSTLSVGLGIPPVSNTIGDLYHEVVYARKHSGIVGLSLARGTSSFAP